MFSIHKQRQTDMALLVCLTILWGLNWPLMKDAVRELPPLYFRAISMTGGLVALGAWIKWKKLSFRIPQSQWGNLVLLSVPNMVLWHLFVIYGVKLLSSGRAAVLGYTMPIWAALVTVVWYKEKINLRVSIGLGAALIGVGLLIASEWQTISGRPFGVLFMLIAASAWGFGTVLMRRLPIHVDTTVLTWWMLLVTTPCIWFVSAAIELQYWWRPNSREWLEILYNAVLVFAFCHVVWFRLARTLPPVVSSLSVMLIPVVGVFAGMLWLGEKPHWQDFAALALLLVALASVLFKQAKSK